jgi:predicted GIY-YIG superfamily endonuclease
MPISVYVLKGRKSGKRYVGITNDLARRLREHTTGNTKASHILGAFGLLCCEEFPDYSSAR